MASSLWQYVLDWLRRCVVWPHAQLPHLCYRWTLHRRAHTSFRTAQPLFQGGNGAVANRSQRRRQDVARKRSGGAPGLALALCLRTQRGEGVSTSAASVATLASAWLARRLTPSLPVGGPSWNPDRLIQRGHDSHRRLQHAQNHEGQRRHQGTYVGLLTAPVVFLVVGQS